MMDDKWFSELEKMRQDSTEFDRRMVGVMYAVLAVGAIAIASAAAVAIFAPPTENNNGPGSVESTAKSVGELGI